MKPLKKIGIHYFHMREFQSFCLRMPIPDIMGKNKWIYLPVCLSEKRHPVKTQQLTTRTALNPLMLKMSNQSYRVRSSLQENSKNSQVKYGHTHDMIIHPSLCPELEKLTSKLQYIVAWIKNWALCLSFPKWLSVCFPHDKHRTCTNTRIAVFDSLSKNFDCNDFS